MFRRAVVLTLGILAGLAQAQTEEAYGQSDAEVSRSLLDASRFSVSHSLSFGMASSSQSSDLKSQGLYSTLITYRFAKPVTLNLNLGLPIFSTYNDSRNLTWSNIESLDYFKSMPFDVSLDWKPRDNLLFRVNVSHRTAEDMYFGNMGSSWRQVDMFGEPIRP